MKTTIALSIITVALLGIAKAAEEGGETFVSPKEFKQHYARVGMPETMRSTRYLGQRDGKALIRVDSMNPLTRSWSHRTICVKLDELDPAFRDEVVKAAENPPVEDVAFFEEKYQTKITGVKPMEEYDDPDTFYSAIAKQLGIPKLALEAAAEESGWKQEDGKMTAANVGRAPGQWQVMIARIATSPDTEKPDPATLELKMVFIDDDKNVTFPELEERPRKEGVEREGDGSISPQSLLAALETARKHFAHYLRGKPQNLADTYAERITLMPGHAMLRPEHGLAGPKGMDEAVTVKRAALIKELDALFRGRALLTAEQLEEYFKAAKTEILGVTSGDFAADPPKPIHTPDGKLHFAIEKGDVVVKIGDPERHFTFLQLRKIDGSWRVVAESKP